jgi:hypothetical protein
MAGAAGCNVGDKGPECEVDLDCGEGEICLVEGDTARCEDRNVVYQCEAYVFQDNTYNCDQLDRCTEQDLVYRVACCECDPELCNPDPTCGPPIPDNIEAASSCMKCHNGATDLEDYSGTGQSNPHPFQGAAYLSCVNCHGGNGDGDGKLGSHVSPPPQIGDKLYQTNDAYAYFNRLTLTGLDKLPDYVGKDDGINHTALDYVQFVNPGDLRVVSDGRSCGTGGCHAGEHAEWVPRNPIATSAFWSATLYTVGAPIKYNNFPAVGDDWYKTAGEFAWRETADPDFQFNAGYVGAVGKLYEAPEYAQWGTGEIYNNPVYDAATLANYIYNANNVQQNGNEYVNQVIGNTPLEKLVIEAVSITCGDCHLGSAGANNRYGDFRSSGCASCHMEYSLDGRSRTLDPNVNKLEPVNPDAIAAPERSHAETHQLRNVAKILPNGAFVRGISDKACAGCHQGSNRTVIQYWGVRLDQNADLANGFQYPDNPDNFVDAANDVRFFDPAVNNNTFNGREANQLIVYEDYDADQRDDTPADVHYEAGMGCIDCHGSRDLHGGTAGDDTSGRIVSRQDQNVFIQCESCHGGVTEPATYVDCTTYAGDAGSCATDRNGNPLRHVTKDAAGDYWLVSRLNGQRHYVPQTIDTIVNNNKVNPLSNVAVYSPAASYAMGRNDGNPNTGIGPQQADPLVGQNFSHTDNLDCVACHAAWTNNCVGCHLSDAYDADPNNFFFSNVTGERIVLKQQTADFTYISPIPFFLGVNSRDKIAQISPAEKMFFRYFDLNGNESDVYAFTDRNGIGNNPNFNGSSNFPALSHNMMMPHSIRGRVNNTDEGPRYCVSCHLTVDAIANFADYAAYYAAYEDEDYATVTALTNDLDDLRVNIGLNTGNQNNNPYWVHMVAGLGSGLFWFDATGCPVNTLDANANRQYCPDGAPADNFDVDNIVYDLDRIVEVAGFENASSTHPMLYNGQSALRGGENRGLAGPLGIQRLEMLAHPDPNVGLHLTGYLDADGAPQGQAANLIN